MFNLGNFVKRMTDDPSKSLASDADVIADEESARYVYDSESGINEDTIGGDDVKSALVAIDPSPRQGRPATIMVYRVVHEQPEQNGPVVTRHEDTGERTQKFYVVSANMPQADRFSVLPTFGDEPDVLLTFGKEPHMWNFTGVLRNEWGKNAWFRDFDDFYRNHLRASLMAQRRHVAMFRLGDIQMEGYILSMNVNQSSEMDDGWVQFSFQMYVRDYIFTTARDVSAASGAQVLVGDTATSETAPDGTTLYTIQSGDSLSKIAMRHGVTVSQIMAINPQITHPDLIRAGEVITIPSS